LEVNHAVYADADVIAKTPTVTSLTNTVTIHQAIAGDTFRTFFVDADDHAIRNVSPAALQAPVFAAADFARTAFVHSAKAAAGAECTRTTLLGIVELAAVGAALRIRDAASVGAGLILRWARGGCGRSGGRSCRRRWRGRR
jgi:hypothetical protein